MKSSLEKERKETDESLVAERNKTNQSILKSRIETEQKIDADVDQARATVDAETSASRSVADEIQSTNTKLQAERIGADKKLAQERERIDVAIDNERAAKKMQLDQLLKKERGLTDKNLNVERTRTDKQVDNATEKLSSEIDQHRKTKFSLTSRDEFMAILSHDLRNPIGVIASGAELLLEEPAYTGMNPEVISWLKVIKRNADSALRLITHLLDMEAMSEGKLLLRLEPCSLRKLVDDVIVDNKLAAAAKSVRLTAESDTITDSVTCDRDRVMQVLSNLVGNAVKFTPENGSITIKVKPGLSETEVCVEDTGPGVPDDKKDIIFDRFAQLASKTRTGLGLGLYISKMIIDAHGGDLWVESEPGKGSRFCFILPNGPTKKQ